MDSRISACLRSFLRGTTIGRESLVPGKGPAHHLAQRVIYLIMKNRPTVLCKFFFNSAIHATILTGTVNYIVACLITATQRFLRCYVLHRARSLEGIYKRS